MGATSVSRAGKTVNARSVQGLQSTQARAQRGLPNGTLAFGYARGEDGVPIAHPTNAEGVVLAFTTYVTGTFSDAQIAEVLNRAGFRTTGHWGERPFTKDTVNRLLKNPFYLGVVHYKGQQFPGKHQALVDQALFDRCQAVRAQRASPPRQTMSTRRLYLLAGLVRCSECHLTLRGAAQSISGYRYYRHTARERGCACHVPPAMIRAELLEEQWATIMTSLPLPDLQIAEIAALAALAVPTETPSFASLWDYATPEQRRELTRALVTAIDVDVTAKRIAAIEPTPDRRSLFSAAEGLAVR